MIREVVMPKLGQTMEEASIEAWRIKEGDTVQKGDILLEINTDKAALEVESFYVGVVKKLLYPKGATVPCNAVIAFLGEAADAVTDDMVQRALAGAQALAAAKATAAPKPSEAPAPAAALAPTMPPATAPPTPITLPLTPDTQHPTPLFASPRARRTAADTHVPLQVLRGSGPNGRIVEADVLAHAARMAKLRVSPTALELAYQRGLDITRVRPASPGARIMRADVEAAAAAGVPGLTGRRVALTPMRRVVAQRMTLSKATIPHFYLTIEMDMTAAVEMRRDLATSGRKVSFNDLIIRACTLAFDGVPEMNVAWADGALLYRDEVNVGLAVGLEGGLIVPVVRNCQEKSLFDIARDTEALVAKARNKRLTPDDYEGGCVTVSNLGMFAVDSVLPIINPGEAAILGVGRIAKRPVVVGDGIAVRQMATFVLACDHRLVDGVIGARFLQKIKELLEAPSSLA